MSDTPEGVGWWQASDGMWYPPEQAGQAQAEPAATEATPAQQPGGQGGEGGPPTPPPSSSGSGGGLDPRILLAGIGVVVAIAVVGAIFVMSSGGDDEGDEGDSIQAAGEVFLQPADEPGPDAFSEDVEELTETMDINFADPTPTATPTEAADDEAAADEEDEEATTEDEEEAASQEDEEASTEDGEEDAADADPPGGAPAPDAVTTVASSGTTPGLYGGTRDNAACNKQAIIDFLAANPDKARAWAAVHGINPADLPAFIDSLTPVVLMADTRVTNHGFTNGVANGFQAVLQRGTAVLVDDKGDPKARCACGNPLLTPVPQTTSTTYTGNSWTTFNPQTVVVVAPGPQVTVIIIQDVYGGDPFGRPTGTDGTQDEDAPPEIITIIDRMTFPPPGGPPTTTFVDDFGTSTTIFEDDFSPPTTSFSDDFSGGRVLAATDICTGWGEFFATFFDFAGGAFFSDSADYTDPAAAHDYWVAAMQDLADLSPNEELREAHLVMASATQEELVSDSDDPRFEDAGAVIEAHLEGLCPEFEED